MNKKNPEIYIQIQHVRKFIGYYLLFFIEAIKMISFVPAKSVLVKTTKFGPFKCKALIAYMDKKEAPVTDKHLRSYYIIQIISCLYCKII